MLVLGWASEFGTASVLRYFVGYASVRGQDHSIGGEDGQTGRVSERSMLSSLGLEIMLSSMLGRGRDSKEVRGSELTGG